MIRTRIRVRLGTSQGLHPLRRSLVLLSVLRTGDAFSNPRNSEYATTSKCIVKNARRVPLGHLYRRTLSVRARPLELSELTVGKSSKASPYSLPVAVARTGLHDIYTLGDDKSKWNLFLNMVGEQEEYNDAALAEIEHVWTNMLDMFATDPSQVRLHKLCQLWVAGTAPGRNEKSVKTLQDIFLKKLNTFIHVLINTRSFAVYTKYVEPLYTMPDYQRRIEKSWADEVISTLQFRLEDDGSLLFNEGAIRAFLNSSKHSRVTKQKMITMFIRKGLLYTTDTEDRFRLIEYFLRFVRTINDDNLLFIDQEYKYYWKAIAEIAKPPEEMIAYDYAHKLLKIFEQVFGKDKSQFYNFLTLAMNSVRRFSPATALNYWDYKFESVYNEVPQNHNEPDIVDEIEVKHAFHYRDLTNAMKALRAQNLHKQVFELHTSFPELHHDEQIDTMLYTCEDSKDWMMLQNHFESMYGKGDLPLPIHYAIVMNALASIGATKDVERLFSQLIKRKLIPSAYVYAALIKCRLNDGHIEDAIKVAESYFSLLDKGKVSDKPTTYLYNLILTAYTRSSDLPQAMKFLERVVEQQESMKIQLISYPLLGDLVRFASKNLGINEIQDIRKVAKDLEADGIPFRLQLIKAYTALGFYEKAEEEIIKVHQMSYVPFNLPHVCAAQVRNYFFWYQMAQSKEKKQYLVDRIKFIVSRLYNGSLGNSGKGQLIAELIRYYVYRGPLSNATNLLELAKSLEVLDEKHYLPLLKHYSSQNDVESQQDVLALYKDMAVNRINAGAKTYVSLMKALIYLDARVGNFDRSQELLRTIFDTYGLSMTSPNTKDVVSFEPIFKDVSELCSIVSQYVMARQPSPNELLFNFLEQMKRILNDRITNDFRYLISMDMARLYFQQGNVSFAVTLAKNTIGEMNEVFEKYWKSYAASGFPVSDFRYPKNMIQTYQKLTRLLFANSNCSDIEEYYREAEKHNAQLLGSQYNTVIQCLLDSPKNHNRGKNLKEALYISERHLISGNWTERKLYKKLQNYWKLFVLHQFQTKGISATMAEHKLLNEFYDIREPKLLITELHHVKKPLEELELLVQKSGVPFKKNLKVSGLLKLIPQVFNPEYKIFSENKLQSHVVNQLRRAVNQYVGNNKNKAFQLMDEYENTVMFLIEEEGMGRKMWKFRKEIDQISKPQGTQETLVQRRKRTIEALTLAQQGQTKAFL